MLADRQIREAIHGLKTNTDKVLAILSVDSDRPKPVSELIRIGRNLGIPEIRRWNVSALLRATRHQVIRVPEGWLLTSEGRRDVAESLGLNSSAAPKLPHGLHGYLVKITDDDTRAFIEEAIACYEGRHFRAAVVLSWVGAMSILYQYVVNKKLKEFNAQALARDPKWRVAKSADGLARMREREFLEILEVIGILGKNVKQELQNNSLELRNSCGHPNSFKVGEHRVAAHIETLVQNVFSRFV